jgi:hypothetical protein
VSNKLSRSIKKIVMYTNAKKMQKQTKIKELNNNNMILINELESSNHLGKQCISGGTTNTQKL